MYLDYFAFQIMKHHAHQHEHGIGPLFDKIMAPFNKYPDAPGYKRDGTSKDAAGGMLGEASTLRKMCYEYLTHNGSKTSDEMAFYLDKSILSIRPRMSELVARGKIEDSGLRRKNVSGKSAIVWRAV